MFQTQGHAAAPLDEGQASTTLVEGGKRVVDSRYWFPGLIMLSNFSTKVSK